MLCTDKSDWPRGVPESGPLAKGPRPSGGPRMCVSSSSSSSDAEPIKDSGKQGEREAAERLV